MNIRYLTLFINAGIMIGLPILLAVYFTKKYHLHWRLVWIGAGTFILSQVLHIPFNALITPLFNQFWFLSLHPFLQTVILAVFFGLSAGMFEEWARYGMYRWWVKKERTWSGGLLAGIGHGGVESFILGILALWVWLQVIVLSQMDISRIIPAAQVDLVQSQLNSTLAMPVYLTIMGGVERLLTIPIHLACSLLVLMSFIKNKISWVLLAVLFHAAVDGAAVLAVRNLPALQVELVLSLFTAISIAIILSLRRTIPAETENNEGLLDPSRISTPWSRIP